MTSTSISNLKARLSAFLDIVRQGDEVLVTDRGRVIARLVPVTGERMADSRRDELLRSGRMRAPTAPLPHAFWKRRRPADTKGRSLRALLDERDEGF
jgi:prevent-host-death family protein